MHQKLDKKYLESLDQGNDLFVKKILEYCFDQAGKHNKIEDVTNFTLCLAVNVFGNVLRSVMPNSMSVEEQASVTEELAENIKNWFEGSFKNDLENRKDLN